MGNIFTATKDVQIFVLKGQVLTASDRLVSQGSQIVVGDVERLPLCDKMVRARKLLSPHSFAGEYVLVNDLPFESDDDLSSEMALLGRPLGKGTVCQVWTCFTAEGVRQIKKVSTYGLGTVKISFAPPVTRDVAILAAAGYDQIGEFEHKGE